MNRISTGWLLAIVIVAASARGQGFVNLDFEEATNLPPPNSSVAVSNALPGWSAFAGTNQLSSIIYDPGGGGTFYVGLYGSNNAVLSGNFSVVLGGSSSISQTGLVPASAESLLFEMKIIVGGGVVVSLDGQDLSYSTISTFSNYVVYGADISTFAGQTETLTFSDGGSYELDNIQFSSQVVPEPGGLALLGLGGGVWIYAHVRKRKTGRRSEEIFFANEWGANQ